MPAEHYRRKPTVVEVVRWTGDNLDEVAAFLEAQPHHRDERLLCSREGPAFSLPMNGRPAQLWVAKSNAWCDMPLGDGIARERDGSGFYPIAADRLAEDFDRVEAPG